MNRKVWLPGLGWISPEDGVPEDVDYEWQRGRPVDSLKGVSRAATAKVKRSTTLADVERAVLADEWLGPNQRRQMLAEIRWFDAFLASREQTLGC